MKVRPSIRYKAIILTIIFLSNTIVGFACSIGADMGFNKDHHADQPAGKTKPHHHPPGTKPHSHKHEHKEAKASSHHEHGEKEAKDNCCKDVVAKFVDLDKRINSKVALKFPPFSSDLQLITCLRSEFSANGFHVVVKKYFVRYHHPPIRDIRVAIQSFQI